MFDLSSISSKMLYREFCSRKEIPSTAQAKLKDEYPNLSVDWKETYLLVFNVTLDTKVRAFKNQDCLQSSISIGVSSVIQNHL